MARITTLAPMIASVQAIIGARKESQDSNLNLLSPQSSSCSLTCLSEKYSLRPKHLVHLPSLSLHRSPPSPCPVTYKVTVPVGTPKLENTAGKTSGVTATAKEGQGVKNSQRQDPHPFGIDFTVSCSTEWPLHTRDP